MFEYLADWDPEVLKEYRYYTYGNPLLHANSYGIHSFPMALKKAGLKHYPEELGFLFQKNDDGDTACKLAFDLHGKEEIWRTIEKCFDKTHDAKIVERNHPMTNLYTFMLAARC